MNSKHIIDSYAWIEYFRGSKAGEVAREYIECGGAMTPTIVLAELSDKYRRQMQELEEDLFFIKSKSHIIPLSEEIAVDAGRINASMKKTIPGWGMADSIVLATARKNNAKVVTGDEHFKNLEEAVMITR
jgi:predicted nucleic acid-binding protein